MKGIGDTTHRSIARLHFTVGSGLGTSSESYIPHQKSGKGRIPRNGIVRATSLHTARSRRSSGKPGLQQLATMLEGPPHVLGYTYMRKTSPPERTRGWLPLRLLRSSQPRSLDQTAVENISLWR